MRETSMSEQQPHPLNLPIVEPGGGHGGEATRAVHLARPAAPVQQTLGLPTYRTPAFAFHTAQDSLDALGARTPGSSYSRVDTRTADAFPLAGAERESYGVDEAVAAQPFASGM